MRLAAIDIGTNSTKMTVADVSDDGTLTVVSEDSEVTRLGEGVDTAKRLQDEAVKRTLQAIVRFAEAARSQGAAHIHAAGTSALRDAANGRAFIAQVNAQAGVAVEIITGDREAQLAYAAVQSDSSLHLPKNALLLVFDIGGGSTELILGQASDVRQYQSLNVGAVRLTERYLKSDPPSDDEADRVARIVDAQLASFASPDQPPVVVGIGGTAVNLAAVTRALPKTDPDTVHGVTLTEADVAAALVRFRSVPLAERRQIPGLEPKRADVIIGGILLLSRLLVHFHAEQFTVSARGLRYGLLAEAAKAE